ncbi:YebC/PmpR family DNA-binding transcriptional regulator [Candidatus Woesebacteria bacterium]|nr:YebC/PmpR family DNA-binding transcriptional regulator [Candidatus Woesebacteria bacterium]
MSGHSKWNNIKNRKGAVDSQRSKIFGDLAKHIRKAVKEGGSGDPQFNPTLRTLLDKARSANMPKDKIQKAIDKGSGKSANGASIQEVLYEAFGANGEAYLVQAVTDNPNRTSSEMKFIFSRNGGSLAGPGSARYLFERSDSGDFAPTMVLPLDEGQLSQVGALIETLLEHEDVEDVYCSALEQAKEDD